MVMENGESSPDEFFGSHRMTGIASGVTGMLISQEPPAPTSSSRSLWWSTGSFWESSPCRSSE